MGRISPGPTRWPPGVERRLVPAKSNLKPQTPSREEQSSSNITSDHEQPEDVAKELLPAENTGTAAKEKGAQEQQQQLKPLAPPTDAENILDTEPEHTHMNTEGNHSCDADELEVATLSFFSSNIKSSPRPSLSTDHQQPEDVAKELFALAANTGDAVQAKPSLSTSSLPVFPPPPPPPLPDTAKEEIVLGGIENPSGKDHPANEVPLFRHGVFGAFCGQRKLLLREHDQQALWAKPYSDGELGLDGNQMILQHYHRQQIYEAVRPTIDLSARKLNTTGLTAYSTVAHNNVHSLSDILHHHPRLYNFPHPQDY